MLRRSVAKVALFVFFGMTSAPVLAYGQSPGLPMGGVEQPDTSRIQQEEMQHAAAPAGSLQISFGKKQADWTAATFPALPHTAITVYNEHVKANQTYSGVPLIDLLTKLGVPAKLHGKDFRLYVVAEGSDGYQVVYSIGEIAPEVHDGTVLVADAVDGKPLGNDGLFQLVATGEKRPARWVRNLVSIRVLMAP